MSRASAAMLFAFGLLSTAHANVVALPYQAGAGKKADAVETPESRQKIVEDIRADYEKVLERLSKDDPGAETRKNQKRIVDNIDKLLQQQDPNQGGGNMKPNAGNPPKPTGSTTQEPNPKPRDPPSPIEGINQQPPPLAKQKKNNIAAKPTAEVGGDPRGEKGNTFAQMQKEAQGNDDWRLPLRLRQEMDAFARERFIRNYEETLRAYYRNLAESSRRKELE